MIFTYDKLISTKIKCIVDCNSRKCAQYVMILWHGHFVYDQTHKCADINKNGNNNKKKKNFGSFGCGAASPWNFVDKQQDVFPNLLPKHFEVLM